ncbi:MAG TPA: hypothetical protein VM694_29520 [Polyangium sp.]|nr:hypothetical protein [Polyangium sp.]
MKGKAAMFGGLLVGLGLSGTAMAQDTPLGCSAGREARAFESGLQSGKSLVQQAWNSVASCGNLERFSSVVMETLQNVSLPPGSDDYVVCRTVGTLAGAVDQVDDIWGLCATACCDEGELVGWIMGKLYCDLSICLGGVRLTNFLVQRPMGFCGSAAQACCRSEFTSITPSYQGLFGSCRPYTQGMFRATWSQSRDSVCAYRQ